jgi:hypothetical protein
MLLLEVSVIPVNLPFQTPSLRFDRTILVHAYCFRAICVFACDLPHQRASGKFIRFAGRWLSIFA